MTKYFRLLWSPKIFPPDIDECSTIEDICDGGICTNERGTFQCVCPPGFEVSEDGTKCVDQRQEECYQRYQQGQSHLPSYEYSLNIDIFEYLIRMHKK